MQSVCIVLYYCTISYQLRETTSDKTTDRFGMDTTVHLLSQIVRRRINDKETHQ